MDVSKFVDFRTKLVENIGQVIKGKDNVIELLGIAFIAGGHILLEDIPGVGKTTLVKAFAKILDREFKRIQFTPDLLPSDLTGVNFYNQKNGDFEFRKGPLFTNILLADEINRATPRTQSSLLEAMEECQITVDGDTRLLESIFMVLATQNPIEQYGTFPLPEAQMDRFFMRINMGYPSLQNEIAIVQNDINHESIYKLGSMISIDEVHELRSAYKNVRVSEDVMKYITEIIGLTRNDVNLKLGVSPRGTLALYKASQIFAAFQGRDFVVPEDIKYMAPFVLNHRIMHRGLNKYNNIYEYIELLLRQVEVPMENRR